MTEIHPEIASHSVCEGMYKVGRYVLFGSLATALAAILAVSARHQSPDSVQPFSSAGWLRGDARERGAMARDLHDRKLLSGKGRDEVIELLGSPDQDHGGTLIYKVDLGYRFAFSPWLYDFLVVLDQADRVIATDLRD